MKAILERGVGSIAGTLSSLVLRIEAQREAPRRRGQGRWASGGSQLDVGEDLEGALTEGEGFRGDGLRLFVHRPIAPWGPGQVGEGNPPLLGADEEVADQDTLQLIE